MSAEQAQTAETTAPAASASAAAAPSAPAASAPETPLSKLNAALPGLVARAGHTEMWGVELSNLDHIPTKVVLQKFLRANNGDPKAAEQQLFNALEWRKKMQPASLVNKKFEKKQFQDLGFVTTHKDASGKETVITWNIYGAVKDNKATFGDVDEYDLSFI
jgi:phosphatidylinositol transfer protein SFH5